MLRFIVRKLAHIVPVLFLVSLATMLMVDLSPGDPAYAILGENATPEQVALINEEARAQRSVDGALGGLGRRHCARRSGDVRAHRAVGQRGAA